MIYSFRNDYSEGAHESILKALQETNLVQTIGYGEDEYCKRAKELIRKEIGKPEAGIYFISGGTQTNLLAISSFLRPHEAVIGTTVSHINVHETGAIEATGHKVLTVKTKDGILTKEHIVPILKEHNGAHMVKPKMVYISNSTEVGTIYKKEQLEELSCFCKEHNLILFLDGARLGSALCSKENNMTIKELADLVDCFSIGGTKNGALFGEALVFCNTRYEEEFLYMVKQKGALLAKGRLLGIQFEVLFQDGLYYRLAEHANQLAMILKEGLCELNVDFLTDSYSNQLFPIFNNTFIQELEKDYEFEVIEEIDKEHTCIRLITSWATEKEKVEEFLEYIKEKLK